MQLLYHFASSLLPPPRRQCFCQTLFVCLSVCDQGNSKSYGRIFLKFWGNVGHGPNYKWFNFGGDLARILDSGSLRNFRYHCVKGGIRKPLAKWIWWRHLANNIALAQVPAGYHCFLVDKCDMLEEMFAATNFTTKSIHEWTKWPSAIGRLARGLADVCLHLLIFMTPACAARRKW